MTITSKNWLRDLLILSCLIGIFYGALLGARPLMSPDEGRYAEIAREMVATNNYLTPHLDGLKYFEKPPLFYWLESATINIFGIHEWSLRLVTAFMGLCGCLITYLTARRLFDRRTGLLASTILATTPLYYTMAHFITLDMTVSVFLTACLYAFILGAREPPGIKRNYYMWSMYLFAALATLTKGLIGVVLPGLIIFTWLCLVNEWRNLKTYCLISGTILFLIIAAPWHILVQLQNPEFFRFYFIDQHFLRYLTDYAQRDAPLWFFPVCLIIGFFPWTGFLLQALYYNLPKSWQARQQNKEIIFFYLWILIIFVFFFFSQSQLISYLTPLLPPLAILVGRYLAYCWPQRNTLGINLGYISIFLASFTVGIIGSLIIYKYVHEPVITHSHLYLYLTSTLLLLLAFSILVFIRQQQLKYIFSASVLWVALCLISINLSYPVLDSRPIKPLASVLIPLLKPTDQIVSFHYYYQDLPVYIQRPITVVGWRGELAFGMQHQANQKTVISDETFWKQWHTSARMFMIMSRNDYEQLRKMPNNKFYVIATTKNNILVANQEISS